MALIQGSTIHTPAPLEQKNRKKKPDELSQGRTPAALSPQKPLAPAPPALAPPALPVPTEFRISNIIKGYYAATGRIPAPKKIADALSTSTGNETADVWKSRFSILNQAPPEQRFAIAVGDSLYQGDIHMTLPDVSKVGPTILSPHDFNDPNNQEGIASAAFRSVFGKDPDPSLVTSLTKDGQLRDLQDFTQMFRTAKQGGYQPHPEASGEVQAKAIQELNANPGTALEIVEKPQVTFSIPGAQGTEHAGYYQLPAGAKLGTYEVRPVLRPMQDILAVGKTIGATKIPELLVKSPANPAISGEVAKMVNNWPSNEAGLVFTANLWLNSVGKPGEKPALTDEWQPNSQKALETWTLRRALVYAVGAKDPKTKADATAFLAQHGFADSNGQVDVRSALRNLGIKPGKDFSDVLWQVYQAAPLPGQSESDLLISYDSEIEPGLVSKTLSDQVAAAKKTAVGGYFAAALHSLAMSPLASDLSSVKRHVILPAIDESHLNDAARIVNAWTQHWLPRIVAERGVKWGIRGTGTALKVLGEAGNLSVSLGSMVPGTAANTVKDIIEGKSPLHDLQQIPHQLQRIYKELGPAKAAIFRTGLAGLPGSSQLALAEYASLIADAASRDKGARAEADAMSNTYPLATLLHNSGDVVIREFGQRPQDYAPLSMALTFTAESAALPAGDAAARLALGAAYKGIKAAGLIEALGQSYPALGEVRQLIASIDSPAQIHRLFRDIDITTPRGRTFLKVLARTNDPEKVGQWMEKYPHLMGGKVQPDDLAPLKAQIREAMHSEKAPAKFEYAFMKLYGDKRVAPDDVVDRAFDQMRAHGWSMKAADRWCNRLLDCKTEEERHNVWDKLQETIDRHNELTAADDSWWARTEFKKRVRDEQLGKLAETVLPKTEVAPAPIGPPKPKVRGVPEWVPKEQRHLWPSKKEHMDAFFKRLRMYEKPTEYEGAKAAKEIYAPVHVGDRVVDVTNRQEVMKTLEDMVKQINSMPHATPEQAALKKQIMEQYLDLVDAIPPETIDGPVPMWVYQEQHWFNMKDSIADVIRFNVGEGARAWEIANRARPMIGGRRWKISADDLSYAYKNVILAKLSTMLRMSLGDEALRLPLSGINPFKKLPEDFNWPLELREGYADMFDRVANKGWVAIEPGERRYPEAFNWVYQTRIAQDPVTRIWLRGYDQGGVEGGRQALLEAAEIPAKNGGLKEFVERTQNLQPLSGEEQLPGFPRMPSDENVKAWANRTTLYLKHQVENPVLHKALRGERVTKEELATVPAEDMPPIAVRRAVSGSSPQIMEMLYQVPDAMGNMLKRHVYYHYYEQEMAFMHLLQEQGVKIAEKDAQRIAEKRALRITMREQYSPQRILLEDQLRNISLFLPAWRQFTLWWGNKILLNPLGLGANVVRLKQALPRYVNVAGMSINPQSGIFVLGGPSNPFVGTEQTTAQKVYNTAADYLPQSGILNLPIMLLDEHYHGEWDNVAGVYPFQFSRPGQVMNNVFDRLYFAITGSSAPRPFGRPQAIYDAMIIQEEQTQWLKDGKIDPGKAKEAVRLRMLKEGILKGVVPFSISLAPERSAAVLQGFHAYEDAVAKNDLKGQEAARKDYMVDELVTYRNLPYDKRSDYLNAHQELIPFVIGTSTNDLDIPTLTAEEWKNYAESGNISKMSGQEFKTQVVGKQQQVTQHAAHEVANADLAQRQKDFNQFVKRATKGLSGATLKWVSDTLQTAFENNAQGTLSAPGVHIAYDFTKSGIKGLHKYATGGGSLPPASVAAANILAGVLGQQGLEENFVNGPAVKSANEKQKQDTLRALIRGVQAPDYSFNHFLLRDVGIPATEQTDSALLAIQRMYDHYHQYKAGTREYKAGRNAYVAYYNKVLSKVPGGKALIGGLPERLSHIGYFMQPRYKTPTSGPHAGREEDQWRKLLAYTNPANVKAGKFKPEQFLKMLKQVAPENRANRAEQLRVNYWKYVIWTAMDYRNELKNSYSDWYKGKGNSVSSKVGQQKVKELQQTIDTLAKSPFAPGFKKDLETYFGTTKIAYKLLAW